MFINDQISIKKISLEEAVAKAKNASKPRSLDEILASIDASNKGQVKTASSDAQVKTASAEKTVEAPKAEPVKAAAEVQTASTTKVEVKVAGMPDFLKEKIEEKSDDKKDDKKEEAPMPFEKKDDKKEDKKESEIACKASAKKSFKVAKKLDFRGWTAQDTVKAWEQHGTMDKCCDNVKGQTNNPKMYCALLQVASKEAGEIVKTASAQAAPKQPVWKKVAKLTEKEKSFLREYYSKLYGQEYVSALLENY
jgi:hypothetical protein